MRKVDFELNFKTNLSNIELKGIEKIVDNFTGYVDGFDYYYTSSSKYAMYNVEGLFYDDVGYVVDHFGITENNMLIMVCEDNKENYYYYEIEPIDF